MPFTKWVGALLVWAPFANVEVCVKTAVSSPMLVSFLCSWPSSQRILSAAIQKPSPLRYTDHDGFCPRPL